MSVAWTLAEVEVASLVLAAIAIAVSGVLAVLLRSGYRVDDPRRGRFASLTRAEHRVFLRLYAPASGVVAVAAVICAASGLSFTMGLAGTIALGGALTVALAYLALRNETRAILRLVCDAEVERTERAARVPTLAAAFLAMSIVAVGLTGVCVVYYATNGSVNDVLGLAIGASLVALTASVVRWLEPGRRGATGGVASRKGPDEARVARLVGRTVRVTDVLASFLAGVAAAMLVAYRDPLPHLLFPNAIVYPAAVAGLGVFSAIGATLVLTRSRPGSPAAIRARVQATWFAAVGVSLVGQLVLVVVAMNANLGLFIAGAAGTLVGAVSFLLFVPSRKSSAVSPPEFGSSQPPARWRRFVPSVGVLAGVVVMALVAYLSASRLVVAAGVPPVVDVGLYGVGLAAAGLVSLLGTGLLLISIPDLAGSGLAAPDLVAEAPVTTDVVDRLREQSIGFPASARAFGLSATAVVGVALLVADRVALSNVIGENVVALPANLQAVPWQSWAGILIGAFAAAVLCWSLIHFDRTPARSDASPVPPNVPKPAVGALAAAAMPFVVASVGSVGVAWALGANAVLGFALGLLVVGVPGGLFAALPGRNQQSGEKVEVGDDEEHREDDTSLLLSGTVRAALVLAVGVLLPFAAVITTCYLGCT